MGFRIYCFVFEKRKNTHLSFVGQNLLLKNIFFTKIYLMFFKRSNYCPVFNYVGFLLQNKCIFNSYLYRFRKN